MKDEVNCNFDKNKTTGNIQGFKDLKRTIIFLNRNKYKEIVKSQT